MGWERIHDGIPAEKFQEPSRSISSGRDEHEPGEEAGKSAKAHSQQEIKGKERRNVWVWERVGKWDFEEKQTKLRQEKTLKNNFFLD